MAAASLTYLKDEFSRRKRKNPSYSLRAYARDLHIDSAVLSSVFRGERGVPKKAGKKVAERLGLSPEKTNYFLMSLSKPRKNGLLEPLTGDVPPDDETLTEEKHFRIIADWEHYALLSLVETIDFNEDFSWMGKRLGISPVLARAAVERLISAGLLRQSKKYLKLTHKNWGTSRDMASTAIRLAHKSTLSRASEALESVPLEDRYFGSVTMAIRKDRLENAKNLIREFKRKLSEFLEHDPKSEVYELAIQFFPLTVPEKKESKK